jgi:hypothetical protein
MPKDRNSNKINMIKITIKDILEGDDSDSILCQDIFRFIIELCKKKNIKDPREYFAQSEFKIRMLVNWLLDNNRELHDEFFKSRIRKSYQAHSKTTFVMGRVNALLELNLLESMGQIPSLKTGDTEGFRLSYPGFIVAALLEFKNIQKGSGEYKLALERLVLSWISYIPPGVKDPENVYYHFLINFLKNCLVDYDDILSDFLKYVRQRASDLVFNFSDLRYKLNNSIFKKLLTSREFRDFYYKKLNTLRESTNGTNNFRKLIESQFKLDVESEIERISSSILNFNEFNIKDFQWRSRPQNQKKSRRPPMEDDSYFEVFKEIVFNYQVRNEWERFRSENLSNNDKIIIVVKCENCGLIFPYPIIIETEDLDSILCRRCNHPRLKPYEFENDSNSLYLKEILSRFNVI